MDYPIKEIVYANTESSAKVEGNFLVFSSGARISLDQIKSIKFDISHSWKVKAGSYIAVLPVFCLATTTAMLTKFLMGITDKNYPAEWYFISFGISVLMGCLTYWFSSSGISYFVVIKSNSNQLWGIQFKNVIASQECFRDLNKEIFIDRRPSSLSGPALLKQLKKDHERLRESLRDRAGLSEEEYKLLEAKASPVLSLPQVLKDLEFLRTEGAIIEAELKSMKAEASTDKSLIKIPNKMDKVFDLGSVMTKSAQVSSFSKQRNDSRKMTGGLILTGLYLMVVMTSFKHVVTGLYDGKYSFLQIFVGILANAGMLYLLYWLTEKKN